MPLIGRNHPRCLLRRDAELGQLVETLDDVVAEFVARHQQRIAVLPRAIDQVAVAVAAHVVAVGNQALDHVRIQVKKTACKEECSLDALFLEGADDALGAVGTVIGGEHEADLFLARIAAHDGSLVPQEVAAGALALGLIEREGEGQRGSAVHGGLVGAVVVGIVVIDHVIGLKQVIGVAVDVDHVIGQVHALEAVEDGGIYRAVHQSARGHADAFHDEVAVGGMRIGAATGQFHNHARAPRIAAQQPVAQGRLHLDELAVARQLAVEDALGEHRRGEVIAAPDAGYTPQEGVARLLGAHIDTLDARLDVADEFVPQAVVAAVGLLSQAHVPHVHEGVPLVVAGTVGAHPGCDGLATAIFHCLGQVFRVACGVVEFDGAQFHVIDPVVLLVDVGRHHAHCLGIAGLVDAHLIGIGGLGGDFGGKLGIVGCQHLCTEGKVAGKFTRRAGRSHRGVHEFAALLRLAVDVIDGPPVVGPPTIVGRVVLGQFHADVVAVVGNLVIEFAWGGIHLVEPRQAPINLIDDVGDAVGAFQTVGLILVTEGSRALLPGEHHLVDGVGARGGVLQQVGRVVPAAAHVDALALLLGVVAHVGVLGVATVALERVEAAPLLTHVVEHKVGCTVPHPVVDGKYR